MSKEKKTSMQTKKRNRQSGGDRGEDANFNKLFSKKLC